LKAARRAAVSAGAVAALAGCQPAVLNPQGPVGAADRTILIDSLAIMMAIGAPTILGTLAFAWWFRASNQRARYLPQWAYSGQLEALVWSIPLLVIGLLGGVAWVGAHALDPAVPLQAKAPPLEIQVVSLDWKWLFVYPSLQLATVNQLVIPVDVPVHFRLTSGSVMNAFFIPRLGSMIYTMNGMEDQLNLMADHPGTFAGLSSHYSGDGFADMHFDVRALPTDQFADWTRATRAGGNRLTKAAYGRLEQQSANVSPASYGGVEPDLFEKIVSQQVPSGPGPDTSTPALAISPE
jgi:cytochrome o ubiquinol oxidase subunit 2